MAGPLPLFPITGYTDREASGTEKQEQEIEEGRSGFEYIMGS